VVSKKGKINNMHNEFIEVAKFFTASDAHILRALLEEDIDKAMLWI